VREPLRLKEHYIDWEWRERESAAIEVWQLKTSGQQYGVQYVALFLAPLDD